MIEEIIQAMSYWLQVNALYAVGICFLWGLFSVALSPCHFAALSLFATPQVVQVGIKKVIPAFMLGHVVALFVIGLVLCLFSYQLDILGHYWTVPFGILFFVMSWRLLRKNHCTHCGDHTSTASHAPLHIMSQGAGRFDTVMQSMTKYSAGFVGMGGVYGLLSGTCVLVFLSPILLFAQKQSFALLLGLNAAFAIGHTLPLLLMGLLAQPLHKLTCSTSATLRVPRCIVAVLVACLAFVLVAHPFLEAMGFDFHGHEHVHEQEMHEHDGHDCEEHNHDAHNHDAQTHDGHNHDEHDEHVEHDKHEEHTH